jgi:hypothetical protein
MNVNYPASVNDMTRVCSLLIIARDLSATMVRDFEAAFAAGWPKPSASEAAA